MHVEKGKSANEVSRFWEQIFEQISERYIYQRFLAKSFFFTAQRTEKNRRSEKLKENTKRSIEYD